MAAPYSTCSAGPAPPTRLSPVALAPLALRSFGERSAATYIRGMLSPKDFFRPLAVGAPEPPREIPVRPSRMIHFFPASNPKMVAKVPDMATKVDVLLANLEDGVPAADKDAARAGLVDVGKNFSATDTQLWTRVNSIDSPVGPRRHHHRGHRGRRQARRDHDPEGPRTRGHPLRGPAARPARGQGRPHRADPRPRHPRDRQRRRPGRGDLRRVAPHAGPVARARPTWPRTAA